MGISKQYLFKCADCGVEIKIYSSISKYDEDKKKVICFKCGSIKLSPQLFPAMFNREGEGWVKDAVKGDNNA